MQSGSNEVLMLMRRRYNIARYVEVIEQIKDKIPNCCIGADVITAHPGESDKHFEETYSLIESLSISYLHVFSYSERPNTHSINIPDKVPFHKKNYRTTLLRKLSENKRLEFNASQIGNQSKVIIENFDEDSKLASGWTDNYIYSYIPCPMNLLGNIVNVTLSSVKENRIFATRL